MSHYIKQNLSTVAVPCILGLIAQAAYAVIQLLMMEMFQAAFQLSVRSFLIWSGFSLLGYAVYLSFAAWSGGAEAKAKMELDNKVRHDLFLTLESKHLAEFHSKDRGEYLSWLTNNIKQINAMAWTPFFNTVNEISMLVSCIVVLFLLNRILLLVALVCAVIMAFFPNLFMKKMTELGQKSAEAEARGMSKLKDLLMGLDVLRSFGRTRRFIHKGDEASNEIEDANCRLAKVQNYFGCATGYLSIALQILQQVVTVFLAVAGQVPIGAVASASNLTAGITNAFRTITSSRLSLAASKPYFETISIQEKANTATKDLPAVQKNITVQNLNFRYGEKEVFHDFSYQFDVGKKYAIVGPSGSGKSTLLKILLGWIPDYEGKVLIDGEDARQYSLDTLQKEMSYIEQDVFLFQGSIRDNIVLGEDFSEEEIQRAVRESALDKDLVQMPQGLETQVGEEGSQLSGGQKQRVAIARALIHRRGILLVDEGTSALDQANADAVESALIENPNLTLLLVSHHLSDERKKQFDDVITLS